MSSPETTAAPRRRPRRAFLVGAAILALVGLLVYVAVGPGGRSPQDGDASGSTDRPSTTAEPTDAEPEPTPSEPAPDPTSTALAWGPSAADLAQGIADAAALPLDRAAGAVIVPRYSGLDATAISQQITELGFAGAILFTENAADADQVRAATAQLAAAGAADGRTWPVVVGVDQEGGPVQRLGPPWTQFPAFSAAGASGDPAVVREAARASATELRAGGFTMNFAPVADVTIGPSDPTIGSRSAGSDPAVVSAAVTASTAGYLDGGVLAAVKHFPGHGSVTDDSHTALPVQDATVVELESSDLLPFRAAVHAGAPLVMMSHLAVTAWEPGVPASLSAPAYAYLREQLAFTGVVVTDSLDMAAVTAGRTTGQASVQALAAGADLLLTPVDAVAARQAIVDAVTAGTIPRSRLDEAAGRVITMMRWQAKIAQRAEMTFPVGPGTIGSQAAASQALSDAAATMLTGQCSGPLAGATVGVAGGTAGDQERFRTAAAEAGLVVVPAGQSAETQVRLYTRSSPASSSGDVAVALDQPFAVAASGAPVKVAVHGRTIEAMRTLVALLQGRQTAPGALTVAAGPYPAGTGC